MSDGLGGGCGKGDGDSAIGDGSDPIGGASLYAGKTLSENLLRKFPGGSNCITTKSMLFLFFVEAAPIRFVLFHTSCVKCPASIENPGLV